jgi:thioredoxin 1
MAFKEVINVKNFLKKNDIHAFVLFVTIMFSATIGSAVTEQGAQIPVPGMVTMVDLGAKKCIPCKMMAPIIEELKKEYQDQAAIVFIDVWVNPNAGKNYNIRAIPTQIIYDSAGKEILRHEGFWDKASIVAELQKLGVK